MSWSPPDPAWRNLAEMLDARADGTPARSAFEFIQHRAETKILSFGDLRARARTIAAALHATGSAGETAVLLFPAGLEFIAAFFGCVYAGVRPAPVALSLLPDGLQRIATIIRASGARLVLANSAQLLRLERALTPHLAEDLRWIAADTEPTQDRPPDRDFAPSEIAFLQYSSGSTGDPKGIAISHRNVLHNLAMLNAAFCASGEDISVSWLPHHHDMGLIAGILQSVYSGTTTVLMSPLTFLIRPLDWLATISRYRAALSAGPNFAYEHCIAGIAPEDRSSLDLSCWKVAISGSEPIRAETLTRFAEAFGPCGFDARAYFPSYGLAEATLMVSGPQRGSGARVFHLDASALERNVVQDAADPPRGPVRAVVGCGPPRASVVIVDPATGRPCGHGMVGEILVAGPSVASGYHNRPRETAAVFGGQLPDKSEERYLRTGDLGFLREGQLCIVGRLKDIVIIRGRNLHPADVEITVQACHPALESHRGAAFSFDVGSEERLAIVQEFDTEATVDPADLDGVIERIRDAVRMAHEVEVGLIVLVARGQTPKTTSGKIQRQLCKRKYLSGSLRALREWRAESISAPDARSGQLPVAAP